MVLCRRLQRTHVLFSHPWSHVIIGMWHKYPNPHCTHVVTVDVVDRSVDPETGIVRTERILGCKQKTPAWIVKVSQWSLLLLSGSSDHFYDLIQLFGGSEDAFVREVSYIDPSTQTATITSVNLSLSQFASCLERIHYTPTSPHQTSFSQTAEIQARMAMWRSMADKMESWLVQRFEQNAKLGKAGFADVLRTMWEAKQQHEAV